MQEVLLIFIASKECMSGYSKWRALYGLVILLVLFLLPWWINAILILGGVVYFQWFVEGFVLAVIIDLFYGRPGVPFYKMASVITLTLLFISELLVRPRVRKF